jgi:hypothetical protein
MSVETLDRPTGIMRAEEKDSSINDRMAERLFEDMVILQEPEELKVWLVAIDARTPDPIRGLFLEAHSYYATREVEGEGVLLMHHVLTGLENRLKTYIGKTKEVQAAEKEAIVEKRAKTTEERKRNLPTEYVVFEN